MIKKEGAGKRIFRGSKACTKKDAYAWKGHVSEHPKKSVLMKWIGNAGKAGNVLEGTDGWITRIYKRVSGSILEVTRAH